jgi:hypothetical protein
MRSKIAALELGPRMQFWARMAAAKFPCAHAVGAPLPQRTRPRLPPSRATVLQAYLTRIHVLGAAGGGGEAWEGRLGVFGNVRLMVLTWVGVAIYVYNIGHLKALDEVCPAGSSD